MLAGTTLVETLTAMTLVAMMFGLATLLFANVTTSDRSGQEIKARLIARQANQATDGWQEGNVNNYETEVSLEPYQGQDNLVIRTRTIKTPDGTVLLTQRDLIRETP